MTTVIKAPGEVFADPTVDFAFKRIFGTEKYKEATIGLLNSLITGRRIKDVKFLNVEIPGETVDSRKAFIDVLCTDADDGSLFICEMQNNRQTYFRERMVYYSSKVISTILGEKGDWDFSMAPTYVVAITNFSFPEEVFRSYFDASVRAGFTKEENLRYTKDMMLKQDILNSRRQAEARARAEGEAKGREEGLAEGLEKGKIAVALNLKAMGLSPEDIAKATGLTAEELQQATAK